MLMYSLSMREEVVMTIVHTGSRNPKQACGQCGAFGKVATTNPARLLRQANRGFACWFQRKRRQGVAHHALPSRNGIRMSCIQIAIFKVQGNKDLGRVNATASSSAPARTVGQNRGPFSCNGAIACLVPRLHEPIV